MPKPKKEVTKEVPDPIRRLSAAIQEFNDALADPACREVEINILIQGALEPERIRRPFVLKGRITEEI